MLANLLNEKLLMELAGERAFERGEDYFVAGHVVGLKADNGAITAGVRGTYYYRVTLQAEEQELTAECSCPVGRDNIFCKHCVAVGLAWIDLRNQKADVSQQETKRDATDEEIRTHLLSQKKSSLVELLMEHAEWNPEFHDRLVLATAQGSAKAPDLAAFRAAIDKVIRHRSFVDYDRMPEYTRGIESVVDSLRDLLKRGHTNAVRELTERALEQMESAMDHVDDSDGFMGGILIELQELHLSACREAKPDPSKLAKFLFEWEVGSDWEIFLGAAENYADVLGNVGLEEYRKLIEGKWTKVPALAPGEKDSAGDGKRWRITHMMEALARQTNDIEALVDVKSRDLSAAFRFLEIAQIYQAAGNIPAALEWAERGARAFPVHTDGRLRNFLIEEYHQQGRHDEAIVIAWTSFRERSGLDEYQDLHDSALRAKQWPQWREKALILLREECTGKKKPEKRKLGLPAREDHSDLVEIYLWEGDVETAWTEAKSGGCHEELWLRLAEARAKDYPEDAIAVYSEQLKSTLQWAQQSAYEQAVDIFRKIQKLMMRIGKQTEFASLVESIRAQYKARRNFMKLLDGEKWL
jgi:uncharacterized Zn finger protein